MYIKLVLLFVSIYRLSATNYKLKQVVILSRHNVRTPLAHELSEITPKTWPRWKNNNGELTPKGALLEGYMGEYFALWLKNKGLLLENCPTNEKFFAYTNNKQRTKASAKAFVDKAFPDCNIHIHHKTNDCMDPVFNPVVHNTTKIFEQFAVNAMIERLSELNLQSSYSELQNILDFSNSEVCLKEKYCSLSHNVTLVHPVVPGDEPKITGSLRIGNAAVDTFIMEYYEGFPLEDVAWGLISEPKQWYYLMELNKAYHDVIFNTTIVAKDVAKPLIDYIRNIFVTNEKRKVTFLMGHDSNVLTALRTLNVKPYKLPRQYEKTPVGGKIVFQKWWDNKNERDLLKIEYVYQSTGQLRMEKKLNLNNPPQMIPLELNDCVVDDDGFCPWEDFISILKT